MWEEKIAHCRLEILAVQRNYESKVSLCPIWTVNLKVCQVQAAWGRLKFNSSPLRKSKWASCPQATSNMGCHLLQECRSPAMDSAQRSMHTQPDICRGKRSQTWSITLGKLAGLGEGYCMSIEKYLQSLPYWSSDEKFIPEEILGVVFIRCTQFHWVPDYWNFLKGGKMFDVYQNKAEMMFLC